MVSRPPAETILVVEDESDIRELIRVTCQREGFQIREATTGPEALDAVAKSRPDLVLLDLMLPGLNGYDVCRELRRSDPNLPIIMLTAKGEEIDKVLGLELGADDYITKPFGTRELVARIRANLRKAERREAPAAVATPTAQPPLRFGPLQVRLGEREVSVGERPVPLTWTEFEILSYLAQNAGQVLTREQIINHVWGYEGSGEDRLLDSHIKNLRRKIEPDSQSPRFVVTVRQVGYKLQRDPTAS